MRRVRLFFISIVKNFYVDIIKLIFYINKKGVTGKRLALGMCGITFLS